MRAKCCIECGAPATCDHHIIPRSLGGTATVPMCHRCHGLVHKHNYNISKLTSEALQRKRLRAERVSGGIPYGFRLAGDGKSLEPDELEGAAIARARELHSKLGLSLRAIARELELEGYAPRNGGTFQANQVRRMLKVSDLEVLTIGEFSPLST